MTYKTDRKSELYSDPEKGLPVQSDERASESGKSESYEPMRHNGRYIDEDSKDASPHRDAAAGLVALVLSTVSSRSSHNPEPPPDGGWGAWSMCACAHVVLTSTWGFVNSFGIFQAYYADFLALPPSQISWIGSTQVFLTFFLSTFTGRVSDAGYFHHMIALGTFFQIFGVFTASFCTQYWQLMLSQGVCIGIAAGCLCCPIMSVTSTYFSKRRSIAIGIVTCGNVTGGLIFPAMARQLLPTVGFGWTLRAIGFIQAVMLIGCNLIAKTRVAPNPSGPLIDLAAFKELPYLVYGIAMFFNLSGTFIAYYYVASFGRTTIDPPMSYPDSLNLLLILHGISIVGRLGSAALADRVGPLTMMLPNSFISALLCLAWISIKNTPGIYAWATIYGIVGGGLQGIFPSGIMSLTPDVRQAGMRMGMCFTIVGFSVLAGPPVAGAIITMTDGSYVGAQAYAGSLLLLGAIFVSAARLARTGTWLARI